MGHRRGRTSPSTKWRPWPATWQQRVQEVCFELLGTDRGNFEFHPSRSTGPNAGAAIKVADALAQARQRLAEWQELQALIPSLDVQPRLVTELDPGQVTLDREQWRVLTAVDGRRNLRSIGRALNLSDFEVCRAMRELLHGQGHRARPTPGRHGRGDRDRRRPWPPSTSR